jgi:hypothetical protein
VRWRCGVTIHRAGLSGRPSCGAIGPVKLSCSGASVTCAACERAEAPPSLEAQRASIAAAALAFRNGGPNLLLKKA